MAAAIFSKGRERNPVRGECSYLSLSMNAICGVLTMNVVNSIVKTPIKDYMALLTLTI